MKLKLTIRNIKNLKPATKPYEVIDDDIKGFLLRVQPSGVMNYYLSYRTVTGTKKRYRIGNQSSISPEQARDIARKLTAKHLSGVDVQSEKKEKRKTAEKTQFCVFREFLDQKFLSWITGERKDGKYSVSIIKKHFKHLLEKPITEINHWLIDSWRSEQLKLEKNPQSLNRQIAYLRGCFSKAIEWGVLESNPLSKLKPLKIDNAARVRYLSHEEEIRLRKYIALREIENKESRVSGNEWRLSRGYDLYPDIQNLAFTDYLQPMIILSINTGLRQGELFNLKWKEDIDFERAMLTVNGKTAKSKKTRHIPLNKEALSILQHWRNQTEEHDFVFSSKDGKRFNNVRKSWASLLKKADIHNFRWHDLRHHFASKLAMAGVDLNTIRELLGHSDLTMTLRYAHLAPEHKAAAVAKLDALRKKDAIPVKNIHAEGYLNN